MDFSRFKPPHFTPEYAERMGEDYAKNGANTTNCHFAIFATHENMKAWERGRDKVRREETPRP